MQNKNIKTLKEIRVLVCTDIAARGIDIENLPCEIGRASCRERIY